MVESADVIEYQDMVRAYYRGGTSEWLKSEHAYLSDIDVVDDRDGEHAMHIRIIGEVLAERVSPEARI